MHTKVTIIKEYLLYIKRFIPELKYKIYKPLELNQLIIDGRFVIYSLDNLSIVEAINRINKYINERYDYMALHYFI